MSVRIVTAVIGCILGNFVGCDGLLNAIPDKKPATEENSIPAKPVVMERVVAEAGVGLKGRGLKGPTKVLRMKEQELIFGQAIYAVKFYKAEHGTIPQSHDEYLEKIIKKNNLKLPQLPEGHTYIWIAEEETLYVERPKQ